jgi:hypothetical protein
MSSIMGQHNGLLPRRECVIYAGEHPHRILAIQRGWTAGMSFVGFRRGLALRHFLGSGPWFRRDLWRWRRNRRRRFGRWRRRCWPRRHRFNRWQSINKGQCACRRRGSALRGLDLTDIGIAGGGLRDCRGIEFFRNGVIKDGLVAVALVKACHRPAQISDHVARRELDRFAVIGNSAIDIALCQIRPSAKNVSVGAALRSFGFVWNNAAAGRNNALRDLGLASVPILLARSKGLRAKQAQAE